GSDSVSYEIFQGSHWLKSAEATGVEQVNETCTYAVVFEANVPEDKNAHFLTATLTEGSLVTTLTKDAYEGTACYKFTTSLVVKGTYFYNDMQATIDDEITSEAYFLGINNKLVPLYSTKYNRTTVPVISSLISNPKFGTMEYQTTTVYNLEDKTATVTVTALDASSEGFKVNNSTKTYSNVTSNVFFDNETLLFAPRAAGLSDKGFSSSFYTIDAVSQKVLNIKMTVSSSNPTSEIEFAKNGVEGGAVLDGITIQKLPVYNLQLAINDTFSGSALELFFATDTKNHYRRLVQYKQQLAYSAGTFVFTLANASTN
ncbi:MAG: hypothetical protein IKT32_08285, partial [Clostridia bacterium]|nr:hypothetical protein [Clostridia bacterium]